MAVVVSEIHVLEGVCEGRSAKLTVSSDAVELSFAGGEPRRIPLSGGVQIALTERGPTGAFATAGVFLLALATLWTVNGTAAWSICAGVGLTGLAALWLGFKLRVSIVTLAGPEVAVAILCRGPMRRRAREAVEAVLEGRPGSAKKPSASIAQFVLAETRALLAGEAKRRREYRQIAGERADPQMEGRFVAARGRIALWNLLWTVAIPLAGAGLSAALVLSRGSTEAMVVALGVFLALEFVGLKLLPRMQPLLARLLK